MVKKLLTEFIGTFFLVLVIALTGNPLAIGGVLVAVVYMGGYISGAHYNPAVTLALWVNKKLSDEAATKYVISQVLGGFTAAFVYALISGKSFIPAPGLGVTFLSAVLVEALFTFLLATVVLHVAATVKTRDNNYFGLAIGFTLMVAAFAGGAISGGAFNPAVGVGPILYNFASAESNINNLLLYIIGPGIGGLSAGFLYKFLADER